MTFKLQVRLYSEDEAIEFLKKRGYTITEPPKPRSGEVVVAFHINSQNIYCFSKERWDNAVIWDQEQYNVLAIVPWTEGQGLDVN